MSVPPAQHFTLYPPPFPSAFPHYFLALAQFRVPRASKLSPLPARINSDFPNHFSPSFPIPLHSSPPDILNSRRLIHRLRHWHAFINIQTGTAAGWADPPPSYAASTRTPPCLASHSRTPLSSPRFLSPALDSVSPPRLLPLFFPPHSTIYLNSALACSRNRDSHSSTRDFRDTPNTDARSAVVLLNTSCKSYSIAYSAKVKCFSYFRLPFFISFLLPRTTASIALTGHPPHSKPFPNRDPRRTSANEAPPPLLPHPSHSHPLPAPQPVSVTASASPNKGAPLHYPTRIRHTYRNEQAYPCLRAQTEAHRPCRFAAASALSPEPPPSFRCRTHDHAPPEPAYAVARAATSKRTRTGAQTNPHSPRRAAPAPTSTPPPAPVRNVPYPHPQAQTGLTAPAASSPHIR
ncbi:hypothetical protein R3P38DRAFT_3222957 [Favolaschia claudopus]|uniref:Uncharacterized protein n=1 Tax=Favolaschia claudopus TaxID=2862362 RepID=A0AAV9ZXZ5_9AGAR